jgi:hypothetical protein
VLGAALTLSLLAHECGLTTASDPLPATDQDNCSFGSIDVAEYRALRREMDAALDPDWDPGYGGRYEALEREFTAHLPELASEDEMLAHIHALARSVGAEFDSGGFLWRNHRATYRYRVDLSRALNVIRPIRRWAEVRFFVVRPDVDVQIVRLEKVLVFLPNIEGITQRPPRSRSCPPLPIPERPASIAPAR